jgi:probable rRNA maturation factor
VTRAIRLLDAQFEMLPGDHAHLSLSPTRLRYLKSQIPDLKLPRVASILPPGELSLVFLTDPALAKIHADFMADPTATDVITFEGDAAAGLAGEICVSADTAARYVGTPLPKTFSAELTLYLVHGWLHLAGYDDLQPAKKRRMRAAEKRAMALLRAAKAIPAFRLA